MGSGGSGKKRKAANKPTRDDESTGNAERLKPLPTVSVKSRSILPPEELGHERSVMKLQRNAVHEDLIHVIEGFLTPEECVAWIQYGERKGFELAYHKASYGLAHRDNGRIECYSEQVAEVIFERLRSLLPEKFEGLSPAGCHTKIRLYRYDMHQKFGKHIDESYLAPNGDKSVFTLLMYLNDEGLLGGETVFYKGSVGTKVAYSFRPKMGAALLHGHGDRCMTHEGKAVRQGQKYLLRTDVMYK
eukprot:CAMPEP_0198725782 /NCGR_PEP_ID=MMETSP1475-20131203/3026_1 /TAXON_ID= ORGANISM="Unidentified sp., Strain CCMP1999" /NCGR_SAMPLE_ID=MMETSP1475 /ASSEMBLY_ACC=CAM_ASM_001111 /LENGTH=244 /DNA_ID=CAMNT_0044487615 /DNA_START=37 /DNA_END=771 /DNA_ORIENTATION=+